MSMQWKLMPQTTASVTASANLARDAQLAGMRSCGACRPAALQVRPGPQTNGSVSARAVV